MPLTTTPQAGNDKRLSGLSVTGRLISLLSQDSPSVNELYGLSLYPRATLKNETRSFLYYLSVYVNLSKNFLCAHHSKAVLVRT